MRRWECPRCEGGKIAPERPRKDDVRRYCLPCSEETGKLVERFCPALERERRERKERRKRKRKRKRERKRRKEKERWTVAGLDCREVLKEIMSIPVVKEHLAERNAEPFIKPLRRSKAKGGSTGRCYYADFRIALTFGWKADKASVYSLILHEVCHAGAYSPRKRGERHTHHGTGFKSLLRAAVREKWGLEVPSYEYNGCYSIDRAITKLLRQEVFPDDPTPEPPSEPKKKEKSTKRQFRDAIKRVCGGGYAEVGYKTLTSDAKPTSPEGWEFGDYRIPRGEGVEYDLYDLVSLGDIRSKDLLDGEWDLYVYTKRGGHFKGNVIITVKDGDVVKAK